MDRGAPLFPQERVRHRVFGGLRTRRQERVFTVVATLVVIGYVAAWIGAIIEIRRQEREGPFGGKPVGVAPTPPVTGIVKKVLGGGDAPAVPFLTDAMLGFLNPLRGESGAVRFTPVLPGSEVGDAPEGSHVVIDGEPRADFTAPEGAGIYKFVVELNRAQRAIDDLSIVTLVPRSQKQSGKIGPYYLGTWPWEEGGKPRSARYAPPTGFIEVTKENQDFLVSEHFRLRDFLTKDQRDVWPKYLLLDPLLIDKLELTIQELEAVGVTVKHMSVMSGFRTPRYNHSGGNTEGRANLSRHMYGDASDVFVDNDRNGVMDDIDGDGRVTTKDAEFLGRAVERVERKHPRLVGGVGVYAACCGHGPFTHVDVRGYRARWRGTGNG
jgi:uncharacterized protein YcbK (DUF882 family)